jgi:hypothetical protein
MSRKAMVPGSQQILDETTHTHLIKMVGEYLYAFIAMATIFFPNVTKVAS